MKESFASKTLSYTAPYGGQFFALPFGEGEVVSLSASVALGFCAARTRAEAHMHAAILTEGTRRKTKEELDILFDSIGSSVSFSVSADRLEFSAKMLRAQAPRVVALIAEMLAEPRFGKKEFEALKARTLGALALEAENTRTQAAIALSRVLYPANHPNRLDRTADTKRALAGVSLADLSRLHRKVNRRTLVCALSGAVDEKLLTLCARTFGTLAEKEMPTFPSVHEGTYVADRVESHIAGKASVDYMCAVPIGIDHRHPDYEPFLILTNILGRAGGFAGRLMREVREKKGLTYGSYAYLRGLDAGMLGYFLVWATFAPQMFAEGRAAVKEELARIINDGVTEKEVKIHRDLFISNWYVNLSETDTLADALHDAVVEGYGVGHLDEMPNTVLKVTHKDIARVIATYLKAKSFSEAAAGPIAANDLSA